jgi:double zinc ribbon protein
MASPGSPSSQTSPSAGEHVQPLATVPCPACGVQASGKFCSNCGASLPGATCATCDAPLSPGAKFCHRCGTPAGAEGSADRRSASSALPWGVAAIALVSLIALVAGQRFARTPASSTPTDSQSAAAPFAGATGNGQAPDISQLSPAERASRLYDLIMTFHEASKPDSVRIFAPMAIGAYGMLGALNLDQHYDVGRIAAVSGDEQLAHAEADTILAQHPNHLLGLILAGNAAHMRQDAAAERTYHDQLVAAAPAERAKQLPEYAEHENDIAIALSAKRP